MTGTTPEGISVLERRMGNGLGEDGEGRSGEGSGCGHCDVAGSRPGCSGKVSADTEEKGIAARSTIQNQGKAFAPKVSLAYKLWGVKNYRLRPVFLDPEPGCSPQS